ncbi:MAG: DUF3122 domain-containing protein [Limnoraphis sp. WC205]|jgi:hypothetical protein|nr:DUF3122 domain-containing protein [Limnoraphis sp. WC205]
MLRKQQAILSGFLILILFLTLNFSYSRPAQAVISKQLETPEQILYQSRHTLQDNTGSSWQVVLFKRVKSGELREINLRLVGFPGEVEFAHVQPLKIQDAENILEADDVFSEKSPAPNVGQYDIKPILSQLSTNHLIELRLPLEKERTVKVPPAVILEWQSI